MPERSVLIVEDDFIIAYSAEERLRAAGFEVFGPAAREADALEIVRERRPGYLLLDVKLADGLGTRVADRVQEIGETRILYATAFCCILERDPPRHGPHVCLLKPYDPGQLVPALGLVDRLAEGGLLPDPLPGNLILVGAALGTV